jgi:hypothetical protein
MIRQSVARHLSMAFVATITACFSLTGFVSADVITNTGPNSTNSITSNQHNSCAIRTSNTVHASNNIDQTAVSGNATANNNTSVGGAWASWNPASWQGTYTDWHAGLMSWMTTHGSDTWVSAGDHTDWTPGASGWQGNWNNWDPAMWQTNGQTYANWHGQLMGQIAATASNWPAGWSGAGGGGVRWHGHGYWICQRWQWWRI